MKSHFRKYRWLYLVCALTIAMPLGIWKLQKPSGIQPESAENALRWIDSMMEEHFGPSIIEEYLAVQKRVAPDLKLPDDPRTNSLLQAMFWTPASEPDLRAARAVYGKAISEMDTVSANGFAYNKPNRMLPFGRDPMDMSNDLPDMLGIQTRAKMHRLLAMEAIAKKDWSQALAELNLCANAANPVRGTTVIGHLIAVAVRAIAYRGYEELLAEGVPLEIRQRAIAGLRRHRETDPVTNRMLMLSEKQTMLTQFLPFMAETGYPLRSGPLGVGLGQSKLTVLMAASELAACADKFEDPALRSMARRLGGTAAWNAFMPYNIVRRSPAWTRMPAAAKFVRLAVEREPFVKNMLQFPEELKGKIDPVTQVLVAFPFSQADMGEMQMRTEVSALRGWLTEAALAAQTFREESGRWPENPEEIILGAAPEIGAFPGEEAPPKPSLRLGYPAPEKNDLDNFRAGLWARHLPLGAANALNVKPEIQWETPGLEGAAYQMTLLWKVPQPNPFSADPNTMMQMGMPGMMMPGTMMPGPMPGMPSFIPPGPFEQIDMPKDPFVRWILAVGRTPLHLLAVSQALEKHPRLVSEVQAIMTMPDGTTQTLPADWARRVADLSDQAHFAYKRTTSQEEGLPPDKRGADRPTTVTSPEGFMDADKIPKEIVVKARLRVPNRPFAIWADGPDRKNDNGTVMYDPTNGTTSRGDLVVLPEGF